MAKKKDAPTGSADLSVLRRSGRETPSRKQTTSSHLNSVKSERIEKHTSPSCSPIRNEVEKIEKPIGSGPLRRSDRGKKLVEITDLPNIKSTKEKTANSSKQSSEVDNEDKKTEEKAPDVSVRKRKRITATNYKALFKAKERRVVSDDEKDLEAEDKSSNAITSRNKYVDKEMKSQNSIRVKEEPVKDDKAFSEGKVIGLDQIEHGDHRQTKSLDGKFMQRDNHTFHTSSYRIKNDLQSQQELDTCHKGEEAFEKISRERDEKRASLENDYKMDKCFIHVLYKSPLISSEKLKILEKEFANKLEEHEKFWEICLGKLKATIPAAVGQVAAENEISLCGSQHETQVVNSGNPEVGPTLLETLTEAQSHDERVCEGVNVIKSSGSHTSKKEMVDAAVSSEQIGEVPAQQLDDDMEVDMDEEVATCLEPAVADHNETGANDMVPRKDSGDIEMPAGNYNKKNDEVGTVDLGTSHVVADRHETTKDVAPLVESADEAGMPAGTCDKENAEDDGTFPDTQDVGDGHNESSPNDILPHVESAELAIPVDQVNIEDSIISPDALHANEDRNSSGGSNNGNPVCAAISQDNTPSVKPVSSPASEDHLIENEPHEEQQLLLATSVASTPVINTINMFDNLTNQVNPQMLNQLHPLQAEIERLYTVKTNVTKFHREMKQRLNTEREKEIAEIVAEINLKYEAQHLEADAAYNSKKVEIETNINRVILNRILAEAFRSKPQDLTPSGHPVSQAESMQQLRRKQAVSPSVRIFNGQLLGNQQPPHQQLSLLRPPQPPLRPPQPPLQIVHQPAALFSTPPSRLQPRALLHYSGSADVARSVDRP